MFAVLSVPTGVKVYEGLMSPYRFDNVTWVCLVLLTVGLFGLIVTICYASDRQNQIIDLSKSMILWSALRNHGFYVPAYDLAVRMKELEGKFKNFERGHSHKINYIMKGEFEGFKYKFPFEYIEWQYTITTTTTSTDAKGNVTVTQQNTDYKHYCFIIDFQWVKGISVRSDSQSEIDRKHYFDTASKEFNSTFKVSGDSTMSVSKFLKPTTVNTLIEMSKRYAELNLDFSNDGQVCFSFKDDDILETTADGLNLRNPNEFYLAVVQGIAFKYVPGSLNFIEKLAVQHDNNFE